MKVLITGGTGTISSGIAEESVERGYETYALTRGKHFFRNIPGVNYIIVDVWKKEDVIKSLNNMYFDVIVECIVYNCEQLKISLGNFADCCKQYIFISTSGVYSRDTICEDKRISESDDKNLDNWMYTKEKIECENYLKNYFANKKTKYTIIRPVVTYGNYRIPFPVVSRTNQWTLLERMLMGMPVVACNNVQCAIIHIKDFSNAVVSFFGNNGAFDEDFHVSESGCEPYWDDVIYSIAKILGIKPKIIHAPLEAFEIYFPSIYDELKWNKTQKLLMDDTKIKKILPKFRQTINMEDGLKETVNVLEKEYHYYNNMLDSGFSDDCDMVIKYVYKKGIIHEDEILNAKAYIDSWSLRKKIRIKIKGVKRIIRKIIYNFIKTK